MDTINKCPNCGCTEIGKGKLDGAGLIPTHKRSAFGSDIYANVCTTCGLILSFSVSTPDKFKEK